MLSLSALHLQNAFRAPLVRRQVATFRFSLHTLRSRVSDSSALSDDFVQKRFASNKKNPVVKAPAKLKVDKPLPEDEDEPFAQSTLIDGLVIERLGDRLLVEYHNSTFSSNVPQRLVCSQRSIFTKDQIVPGDRVQFSLNPISDNKTAIDTAVGVVQSLQDRKNVLQRPSATSTRNKVQMRPIASNIDQLLIVISVQPLVPLPTIDRYIISALVYNIPNVCLVINKADLPDTDELHNSFYYYANLGYKLIKASTKTSAGLDELRSCLKGKTSVFVGQSGVGKSSLVNTLIPQAQIRVGDLISNNNFGAHTTSNARLYHLDEKGSVIIDSPGIRELGVWHLPAADIQQGFVEIDSHAQKCKFRNCLHREEDAKFCAVWQAVQKGEIHQNRYNSFMALVNQNHD